MLGDKIAFRNTLQICRGHSQIAVKLGVHEVGILADHGRRSQGLRLFRVRPPPQYESGNFLVLGLLKFLCVHGFRFQPVENGHNGLLSFLGRVSLIHDCVGPE